MSAYLAAWLPAFPLQAAARVLPGDAAVVAERDGPLEFVACANAAARAAGVQPAMALPQARGRCPRLAVFARNWPAEEQLAARLLEHADNISPRRQAVGPDLVVLDFAGLAGLHGSAPAAARRLEAALAAHGASLRTGIAAHPALALIAAKTGLRALPAGQEADALAPLAVGLLGELEELTRAMMPATAVAEVLALLQRWGIHTLGALAQLPAAALAARLGQTGVYLRDIARGRPAGILNPAAGNDELLHRACHFDPPLGNLAAIQAVVAREAAALLPELERHDRLVERAVLRLQLEGQHPAAVYARGFAVPTRDPRTLAAQFQLALQRTPPPAAVHTLRLECALGFPRRIQMRLFSAAAPDPEKMPKLIARLGELLGSVGSPALIEAGPPRAFILRPFTPPEPHEHAAPAITSPRLALRLFRPPRPFSPGKAQVLRRAGPWRSQGGWWRESGDPHRWACDEWDAEISFSGTPPRLFRLGRNLESGAWYLVGQYD